MVAVCHTKARTPTETVFRLPSGPPARTFTLDIACAPAVSWSQRERGAQGRSRNPFVVSRAPNEQRLLTLPRGVPRTTVGERAGRRPASPRRATIHVRTAAPSNQLRGTDVPGICRSPPERCSRLLSGAARPPVAQHHQPRATGRHAPGQPTDVITGSRERALVLVKEARDAIRAISPQHQRARADALPPRPRMDIRK